MPLVLAGDIHHYNRYEREDGSQQRIVSGSGAAFLYPTHNLPEQFSWPERDGVVPYRIRGRYPDRGTSARLRRGILLAPFKNPSFVVFVGLIYLLFSLMIRFAISAGTGDRFKRALAMLDPGDIPRALLNSPASFLLIALLGFGLVAFADARTLPRRVGVGLVHGAVQLMLIVTIVWSVGIVLPDFPPEIYGAAFSATLFVVGGYLGAQIFAVYLWIMQSFFRKHPTHSFSSQHIQDFRSFLRIRFHEDGSLTVFPIGIRRVPRRWRFVPDHAAGQPWFEPEDRDIECELIEEPIRVAAD
jgi:hypothetical protein